MNTAPSCPILLVSSIIDLASARSVSTGAGLTALARQSVKATQCLGSICAFWVPEPLEDQLRQDHGRCGLPAMSQSFPDPAK